jgi:hypothetical protein
MGDGHPALIGLLRAIASKDTGAVEHLLDNTPDLALASMTAGATREDPQTYRLGPINHYVYAGDTALHVAAAAHHLDFVQRLLSFGADVHARNRRAAQPLHYAADGRPDLPEWDPSGQKAVIEALAAAGADLNAKDKSGVAPLHRAVRTRCAPAVAALLEAGADPNLTNGSGSTPADLAHLATGRGGSGSATARQQREIIVDLLARYGAGS